MIKNILKIPSVSFFLFLIFAFSSVYSRAEETYYDLLGIKSDLNDDAKIKEAYRNQMLKYHPDKVRGKSIKEQEFAKERAAKINNAYDTLKDSSKRASYNDFLSKKSAGSGSGSVYYETPKASAPRDKKKPTEADPDKYMEDVIRAVINYREDFWTEEERAILWKFTNEIQVNALKTVAHYRKKNIYEDYEVLLKFSDNRQIVALELLVGLVGDKINLYYSDILGFTSNNVLIALMKAAKARKKDVANDLKTLLKFTNGYQVVALERAVELSPKNVFKLYEVFLKYDNALAIEALNAVTQVRGSNISDDFKQVYKFNDPKLLQQLKQGIAQYGKNISDHYTEIYDLEFKKIKAEFQQAIKKLSVPELIKAHQNATYSFVMGDARSAAIIEELDSIFAKNPSENELRDLSYLVGSEQENVMTVFRDFIKLQSFDGETQKILKSIATFAELEKYLSKVDGVPTLKAFAIKQKLPIILAANLETEKLKSFMLCEGLDAVSKKALAIACLKSTKKIADLEKLKFPKYLFDDLDFKREMSGHIKKITPFSGCVLNIVETIIFKVMGITR